MSRKNARIFLVEDDASFGSVLKSYLEINDFEVDLVDDGKVAVETFRKGVYDLCILDVMLPHVDGFTIASEIRIMNSVIPIIFLTAKKLKEDLLKGYGVGADDYITKPFDTDILLCKIRAIIARRDIKDGTRDIYEIGKYVFNSRLRTLTLGDRERQLSPKEGQLLEMLAISPNTLVSREATLRKIWGSDDYFTARSMDVYVTKLRKYLSDDPNILLKNIHGSGFQLVILE
ncbi:MAG TPA: response regulator transcription factor [Bacteroidales bacterium]|jgi:two-component system, OmpR family, response regulator|nr:response regulator transcription factor [Bacteroidales bacterium]MDI9532817.1 response regulator transcription factor [Bacteroidota bacterium]MBK7732568.1 response regulator transcription factor [Bacteroidales bacterium]MBP7035622.1 response regulator transcription factor [Bacteroidales bacterium]MBP8709899.1 response regulator transcription factor [Bacteroidales bacterium]